MLVKTEWNHSDHQEKSPAEALTALNAELIQRYSNSLLLSACIVDIFEDHVIFSGGGTPPQYITDGKTLTTMASNGPLLGLLDIHYESKRFSLAEGSRLFLYSDALIEEYNQHGEIIGIHWLEKELMNPFQDSENLVQSITKRFQSLTGKDIDSTSDDLTIIAAGHFYSRRPF
jgi:serine phosphatase RsbU (regulator of sigma subunit)